MQRFRKIGLLVLVFVIAGFIFLRRDDSVRVRTATVTRDSIASTISTNGKIEPIAPFQAVAQAPAVVERVLVKPGEAVKPGQLLVQLDDERAQAEVARALARMRAAEANLRSIRSGGTQEEVLANQSEAAKARSEVEAARKNLDALRRLQQTGAASTGEVQEAENRLRRAEAESKLAEQRRTQRFSSSDLDRVQAEVAEARAAYAAAQDQLRNANITSPRSGTVYNLPIRAGQFVAAGDLLVQVADTSKVELRAFVDEPDIGRLDRGQKVTITWDAMPNRTWEGEITGVPTTVVQRGTRTVGEVIATVNNADRALLPNVNVNAVITISREENAMLLPREAVQQEEGKRFVYEMVDGKLKRTDVQTGVSDLTRIQITGGLKEGTVVATGAIGSQGLREGLKIQPVR